MTSRCSEVLCTSQIGEIEMWFIQMNSLLFIIVIYLQVRLIRLERERNKGKLETFL